MNRRTKKTAAEDRAYNKWVKLQLIKHPNCAVYPQLHASQCHHLCRGVHRRAALMEPCATVMVSSRGHDAIEGMPIEKQIAVKLVSSKENADEVDLPRFCELRGRAPTAILLSDVAKYLQVKGKV